MSRPSKTQLAIWGASGHALVVADAILAGTEYDIVGYLDDVNVDRRNETFGGNTILGGREALAGLLRDGVRRIVIAFGNCSARIAAGDFLRSQGFELPTIIHPRAVIGNRTTIGEGCYIGAGVVIDPECAIGRLVIVNNGAIICHHSVLADGAHICPGVSIAGKAHVGRGSWLGVGSCVRDGVSIGAGSFIGAGSVVVKDIPDGVMAYGVPASVRKGIADSF